MKSSSVLKAAGSVAAHKILQRKGTTADASYGSYWYLGQTPGSVSSRPAPVNATVLKSIKRKHNVSKGRWI